MSKVIRLFAVLFIVMFAFTALPAYAQDATPTIVPTEAPPDGVLPPNNDSVLVLALSLEEIIILLIAASGLGWSVIQSRNIKKLKDFPRENPAAMRQLERAYQTTSPRNRMFVDAAGTVFNAVDDFIPVLKPVTDFIKDVQMPGEAVDMIVTDIDGKARRLVGVAYPMTQNPSHAAPSNARSDGQ